MPEILTVARVRIRPEKRDEFIEAARKLAEVSRVEDGCLEYAFYEDIAESGSFVTVERWVDWEAGKAHFEAAHTRAMMAAVPDFVAAPPTVMIYPAEAAAQVV